jgi:uncharacterized delta-60 repeat protein
VKIIPRPAASVLGALVLVAGFAAPARAERVGRDPSFGDGGLVTVDFAGDLDQTANLVLQPDGKVVVAGSAYVDDNNDLVVIRLNADGTPDPSFGDGGLLEVDSGGWDRAQAIALQPDGKLLIVATLGAAVDLIRIEPDGSLDPSFGTQGMVPTGQTSSGGLALQPDGKILVAGSNTVDPIRQSDAAVARFLPTGVPDLTFGSGGSTILDTGSSPSQSQYESLGSLAVLDDGSILAVGMHSVASYSAPAPTDTLMVRLTASGVLDTGFNGTGWRVLRPTSDGSEGVAVLADSAGRAVVSMRPSLLARVLPSGALDSSFGVGGVTAGPFLAVLARDQQGRIVAAGGGTHYVVDRFSAQGQPDWSFNSGEFDTKVGEYTDFPTGIAVQPDGRLLVAGYGYANPDGSLPGGRTNADWAIQRLSFAPDPPPSGYWMLGRDGHVYPFGDARSFGDVPRSSGPEAVDLEPTPDHQGYWIVNRAGAVFGFGDAPYLGGNPTLPAGETVSSISATPDGQGYWLFTNRGRVLPYGHAQSFGDMSAARLNGPVLDSVATPSGLGYYMVASDGGIFAFGDARFAGSMGGKALNAPVQSLVPDSDGQGYWLVASDGGIFAFDARFQGSMGGTKLNKPVTGMVRYGNGYLMVGEDGGIFNFSDKPFSGSLGGQTLPAPIVSVAVLG